MSLSREQLEALEILARERGWINDGDGTNGTAQRPKLKLPTDDRELHDFARDMGEIAARTMRLFRRDRTPVVVNAEAKRLDVMNAETLRTWISPYVACFREKRVGDMTIQKLRTM